MEQDEEIHAVSEEDLAETLNVVQDIIFRLGRISNSGEIDGLLIRIDMVKTRVVNLDLDDSLIEGLNRAHNLLTESEIDANLPRHSRAGRLSFDVNENQVTLLLEQNFKVAEISRLKELKSTPIVGKRTLERRMNLFGIGVRGTVPKLLYYMRVIPVAIKMKNSWV